MTNFRFPRPDAHSRRTRPFPQSRAGSRSRKLRGLTQQEASIVGNVTVIGAQWGDEGKGKVVDWLARCDVKPLSF